MALILQARLVLGYDVLRGKVRSLPALWWTLAAWSAPLILTPPLFSRDAYAYFTQGKLLIEGPTPMTSELLRNRAGSTMARIPLWAESPTLYGPLFFR